MNGGRHLILFEIKRRFLTGGTVAAAALFLLIHGVGCTYSLDSDGLLGYAFLTALGVGIEPGILTDRRSGYTEFAVVNLMPAQKLATARVLSWLIWILGLTGWAILCSLVLPGGLGLRALRHAGLFSIIGLLLLPVAAGLDRFVGARWPLLAFYLAALGTTVGLAGAGLDVKDGMAWLGLTGSPTRASDLLPILGRVPLALAAAWLVFNEPPRGWLGTHLAFRGLNAMLDFVSHPARHGYRNPTRTSQRPRRRSTDLPRLEPSASSQGDGHSTRRGR